MFKNQILLIRNLIQFSPQLAEIIKETFSTLLAQARSERDRVNYAFLQSGSDLEHEHRGFGVNFWGWTWKMRLFHDLYAAPRGPDGRVIRSGERCAHLKARLAAMSGGDDSWARAAMAEDPKIRKEIVGVPAVLDFCGHWLRLLVEAEARAAEGCGDGIARAPSRGGTDVSG